IEPGEADKDPDKPKDGSSEVEWFGVRLMGGVSTGTSELFGADDEFRTAIHGEIVFATMLWKHIYWDIARIGTGVPLVFTWGMAAGYRNRWGVHEVRAGLHITNYIILPTLSGVEAAYLYDVAGGMKLELGARLMAWPTTIVATAGLKF
ncbi:MAG: hypothetical protein QF464_09970, partial [Myxococcota bacterium]|nr:hypothetical protein [Myxococcota bacterium]